MKDSVITEHNIKLLVDNFYSKVRLDPSLWPIFRNSLEKEHSSWDEHLEKMYAFWSCIMAGGKNYKGSPMQKHKNLPLFDAKLFDRWLELFSETAKELYIAEIAQQYIDKSSRIAESLKYYIYE